jgi:hypothetical protein
LRRIGVSSLIHISGLTHELPQFFLAWATLSFSRLLECGFIPDISSDTWLRAVDILDLTGPEIIPLVVTFLSLTSYYSVERRLRATTSGTDDTGLHPGASKLTGLVIRERCLGDPAFVRLHLTNSSLRTSSQAGESFFHSQIADGPLDRENR